jgi:hypothetical protein
MIAIWILYLLGGISTLVAMVWGLTFAMVRIQELWTSRAEAALRAKVIKAQALDCECENVERKIRLVTAQQELGRRSARKFDEELKKRDKEAKDSRDAIANVIDELNKRDRMIQEFQNENWKQCEEIKKILLGFCQVPKVAPNLDPIACKLSALAVSLLPEAPPEAREDVDPRSFQRNFSEARLSPEAREVMRARYA